MAEDSQARNAEAEVGPASKPSAVYPFLEGHFGIPLNELKTPFVGEVRTGSGRYVICEFEQKGERAWINVDDPQEHFIMHAAVAGDTSSAEIHTRKKDGTRHPDFFAKHFLAFALNYFESEGYPVRKFMAMWTPVKDKEWDSDNYNEYWRIRKEGEDPVEAVKSTWTGKILGKLGFTDIENIQGEEGDKIVVVFKKPGPVSPS